MWLRNICICRKKWENWIVLTHSSALSGSIRVSPDSDYVIRRSILRVAVHKILIAAVFDALFVHLGFEISILTIRGNPTNSRPLVNFLLERIVTEVIILFLCWKRNTSHRGNAVKRHQTCRPSAILSLRQNIWSRRDLQEGHFAPLYLHDCLSRMSDRFGFKVKENAGKTKYSSLNLNQTYKGTKVETKTTSGLLFSFVLKMYFFLFQMFNNS